MEVLAKYKFAKVSPQKCRLVADQIRGLPVGEAINLLAFSQKKSSTMVKKTLESAIANAENNEGADIDELRILYVMVDEGPMIKRMHARAKGRGVRVVKRTCHITISVSDM